MGSPIAVRAADLQETCSTISEQLGAHYSISANGQAARPLDFWRSANRVLYSYPAEQIADQWTLTANGYLKPTRFFTMDERSIEYDPFDINRGKGSRDWESRANWITREKLESLQKTGSSGEGCEQVDTYVSIPSSAGSAADAWFSIELSWMPNLWLVQSYRLKTTDKLGLRRMLHWQLEGLESDTSTVSAAFRAYDGYAATDYADIGDNESDPFLMKMIRLGFVEHGAAGFHDSNGALLSRGHVH